MAYFILGLASILSVASAEDATTSTVQGNLPDYLQQSAMSLSLDSDVAPVHVDYRIAPLTAETGLNQTNGGDLSSVRMRADMVIVDQTNYNEISLEDNIAYITCDSTTDNTYITPSDVLNSVMNRKPSPRAILLFSTAGTYCSLVGSDLAFREIWTMTNPDEAGETRNLTLAGGVRVIIPTEGTDAMNGTRSQGGSSSAVAMSILYSITGLITLLFLLIIATGAIRAHRHPERYGPRAGFGGRPRQSRARGLARAVLETLPIVKFGDPDPRPTAKPDPENELDSISGDRQPIKSLTQPDLTPASIGQGENPQNSATPDAAVAAVASDNNNGNNEPVEDNNLGCSICTEDFSVGQDVRVLPCNHKYHPQCVDPWLVNVSGTCPLCRLDLRPREEEEAPNDDGTDMYEIAPQEAAGGHTSGQLAPPHGDEVEMAQRRRLSRLLDWNRLRHASVDERIQALRQYRQTQQGQADASVDDQRRHAKLSDRLREKFHVRTRAHPPSEPPSTN